MKNKKRALAIGLAVAMVVALGLGAGPGILMLDQSQFVWGTPVLFVWSAFWCGLESLLVLAAYLFLWNPSEKRDTPPNERKPEHGGRA